MFKESLIFIVFLIIIYQIYLNYYESNTSTPSKNVNKNKHKDEKEILEQEHKLPKGILVNSKSKSKNSLMNQKIKSVEFQNEFVHPVYGKPTKLTPNGYLFTINIPKPWTYIIFNKNTVPNHHFAISLIPLLKNSDRTNILNVIGIWVNFLKSNEVDLIFNGQNLELLIPSQDEEFALTVCNLIINNIKGNLNINSIVQNNLIQISMQKIKKYNQIKNKIIEQIIENLNEESNLITLSEGFTNSAENNGILEYNEDLAMSDTNEEHRNREKQATYSNNPENSINEQPTLNQDDNDDNIIGYTNNFVPVEDRKDGLSAFEQSSGTSAFSFI